MIGFEKPGYVESLTLAIRKLKLKNLTTDGVTNNHKLEPELDLILYRQETFKGNEIPSTSIIPKYREISTKMCKNKRDV